MQAQSQRRGKSMTRYEEYVERERRYLATALALVGSNVSPVYNIAPLLDLVRQADALGYDVAARADSTVPAGDP
jgi:hypothetical protein